MLAKKTSSTSHRCCCPSHLTKRILKILSATSRRCRRPLPQTIHPAYRAITHLQSRLSRRQHIDLFFLTFPVEPVLSFQGIVTSTIKPSSQSKRFFLKDDAVSIYFFEGTRNLNETYPSQPLERKFSDFIKSPMKTTS